MKNQKHSFDYFDNILLWLEFAIFIGVGLFILNACIGCATVPEAAAPPAQSPIYALDLKVQVNDTTIVGSGVAPINSVYKIVVKPTDQIDRIQWRTCNQDHYVDKPNGSSWFDIFNSDNFSFTLTPDPDLDQRHHCPLEIDVMAQKVNRVQSAIIDFGDARPEYQLAVGMTCNGSQTKPVGVAVCSSAVGLVQQLTFDRPVIFGDPESGCTVPIDVDGKRVKYQLMLSPGDCLYTAGAEGLAANGQHWAFRIFTHGYNTLPQED